MVTAREKVHLITVTRLGWCWYTVGKRYIRGMLMRFAAPLSESFSFMSYAALIFFNVSYHYIVI